MRYTIQDQLQRSFACIGSTKGVYGGSSRARCGHHVAVQRGLFAELEEPELELFLARYYEYL